MTIADRIAKCSQQTQNLFAELDNAIEDMILVDVETNDGKTKTVSLLQARLEQEKRDAKAAKDQAKKRAKREYKAEIVRRVKLYKDQNLTEESEIVPEEINEHQLYVNQLRFMESLVRWHSEERRPQETN